MSRLTLAQATRVANAALADATSRGETIAVAVVDASGSVISLSRADGAAIPSVEVAIGKATTSASLGVASGDLQTAVAPGGPLFGLLEAVRSRNLVVLPGGVPLPAGRGAVGVGGCADPKVDHEIASAAAQHADGV